MYWEIRNYKGCGCTSKEQRIGFRDDIETTTSGDCYQCRKQRIGEEIEFLRFGDVPEFSRNYRDNTDEEGVSVYEVIDGKANLVGWYFGFLDRPAYLGTGKITGWGSDGEPLVEVAQVKKITKARTRKLTGNAV